MINIGAGDMQQRTYYAMLRKLTESETEKLNDLRKTVTDAVTKAVYTSNWSVKNIRVDDFELLQFIIIELQMKGFKAWYVSHTEPIEFKDSVYRNRYYTLEINWELEN